MSEIARQNGAITVLDNYAEQGRYFLNSAASSFIQFGRVLTEAKPLVPHGQWEAWVNESFGMNARSAQGYMKAWKKFGNDPQLRSVQYSKLRELMALPDGTQEEFLESHDVNDMTSREVKEAVRRVREEMQVEIDRERNAREAAERNAEEIANTPSEEEEELRRTLHEREALLKANQEEINRLSDLAKDAVAEKNQAVSAMTEMKRDLSEAEDMIREQQSEYDRMQSELLNAKSAIAKGDAERHISERMNADDFAGAVRTFMGCVSQMPYMGSAFATMEQDECDLFDQYLKTVEAWAINARKALNTMNAEVYEL